MKHHFWTHWQGPILGREVAHVWSSYAWCLFLEFGKLTEGEPRRDGTPGTPRGEWTLTSMDTWPLWTLLRGRRVSRSSEYPQSRRDCTLGVLIGQTLESLDINESSRRTRLSFSNGLVLQTRVTIPNLRREALWLLRTPDCGTDWPRVTLRAPSAKSA